MKCPECNCKFKQKYQRWVDDDTVICPKCKAELPVKPKEEPEEKEDD